MPYFIASFTLLTDVFIVKWKAIDVLAVNNTNAIYAKESLNVLEFRNEVFSSILFFLAKLSFYSVS